MDKGLLSFLFVFVFMAGCSTAMKGEFGGDRDPASGDGYRSGVDGIDLGAIYQPPMNVTPVICSKFEKDPKTNEDDLDLYKACQQGTSAARYMAERFAQNEGKYLGCVDGLQQGMHVGYLMAKDPSAEQLADANSRYTNTVMKTAEARAADQATREGQHIADSTIISRFRAVVGNNQEPDGRYEYPPVSFAGYDDGYVNDNRGGSFDDVYNAGWVPKGVRDFRAIEARSVYKLHTSTYTPPKLCQPVEVMFSDSLTLWDYFAARGQYNFEKYGWKDENRTLNYFTGQLSGTPEVLFYNAIKGKMMDEAYEVEVKPAWKEGVKGTELYVLGPDGKPVLDPQGRPQLQRDAQGNILYGQYIDHPAVKEIRHRQVADPVHTKEYYQNNFKRAFIEAYRDYYITQYFGLGFVAAHRTSEGTGELIGQLIGKQVAADYADMLAYNNKYKADSIAKYNVVWQKNYDAQWAAIWSKFANHAMVEINDIAIYGDMDDDIFKAGEKVKASVALTNIGRKSEDIRFTMYGDLEGPSKTEVAPASTVPISNTFPKNTDWMAQLSTGLRPREQATVGVKITGAVEYNTGLVTQKGKSLSIRDIAEIDAVSASINEITGQGNVQVRVVNPSKLESPAMLGVRVVLTKNMGTYQQEFVKMNPKETRIVNIPVTGLDPLDILAVGGISGSVQTLMNGRVVSEGSFSAGIPARVTVVAKYFNALAIPEAGVAAGGDRIGRIQEVMGIIQQMTQDDIKANTDWGRPDRVSSTVVGQLGQMFLSGKASGKLGSEAPNYYNELGKNLNTLEISAFKRKAYRKALNVFAPDVKVKKKNK